MLILNIGTGRNAPSAILRATEAQGLHWLSAPCMFPNIGEDTLVLTVPDDTPHHAIYELSETLGEDCIAAYDPDCACGWLLGPWADAWGAFDPSQFILPSGRTAGLGKDPWTHRYTPIRGWEAKERLG